MRLVYNGIRQRTLRSNQHRTTIENQIQDKIEHENLVINISSKTLTSHQLQILNKGLNYVPVNSSDQFEFTKDFYRFCRKIRMKMYFADSNITKEKISTTPARLKARSTFDPPVTSHMLEAFKEIVTQDVAKKWDKWNITKSTPRNITQQEKSALRELENDPSIVLKKADKGGSIVVMDTQMYLNEARRQLSDGTVYRLLNEDPTIKFKKRD